MIDLCQAFARLPFASSPTDFSAFPLPGARSDFLAKTSDGGPVFLLQDSSSATYSPAIELKHLSIHFHSTCRVTTDEGIAEGQFAVVSCDAGAAELHELFIRCLAAAAEQLPSTADTTDLQRCVQSLLDLFRALGRPSGREVAGLWAELFVIARSRDIAQALRAWHADKFERFDFSWSSGRLEVKASVGELRQHEFALEQLQSPTGGGGYVVSVLLQALSGGVGVIDLADEIEATLPQFPSLRQKLWENVASALGSDFAQRLDRRFDTFYAERSIVVYAMSDVPAPDQPRDPRVTAVRFRADLSAVTSSLEGNARAILDGLLA